MSSVPGINAKHRIITDSCRARGKGVAIEEALDSLRKEFQKLETTWPEGHGHQIHVVISIEINEKE